MNRTSLGELIRDARHAAGLRLEDVATQIGVTPGALSHIESGRRLPNPKNAFLISQVLGIPQSVITQVLDEEHSIRRAMKMSQAPQPVFENRPIEALFGQSVAADEEAPPPLAVSSMQQQRDRSDVSSRAARAPKTRSSSRSEAATPEAEPREWGSGQHRYLSFSSPSREAARWSNSTPERLSALDALAAEASEAIRTLRGLLEDEDPLIRREAKRLLRELDVRMPEE